MSASPPNLNSFAGYLDWQSLEDKVIACRQCPRLVTWREEVARTRRRAYRDQEYWGKPVPGFGDRAARILVVGLAPGAHGSNRTGRMFTGDASGEFLYDALYRTGFASQPVSTSRQDDLVLKDIFISAVCRCAPPDNKPERAEMDNCQPYLLNEMHLLENIQGIVALGRVAFDRLIPIYKLKWGAVPDIEFAHAAFFPRHNQAPWLLASYHPSRQNTQTGRLTTEMFDRIWKLAREVLSP
jgi:uracil-DNA glycosylase family 4